MKVFFEWVFRIMGVLALILIAIGIIGSVFFKKEAEPKIVTEVPYDYLYEVIPIISSWDLETVSPYINQQKLKDMGESRVQEALLNNIALGEFKYIDDLQFIASNSRYHRDIGNFTVSKMVARVVYESGFSVMDIVVKGSTAEKGFELYSIQFHSVLFPAPGQDYSEPGVISEI